MEGKVEITEIGKKDLTFISGPSHLVLLNCQF